MPAAPTRDVSIELREGEYVADRGKRKLTWLIRINDGWAHVREWPGAQVEQCQLRSGVVWENLTRLVVPLGTRLTRIESRPAPYAHRDALDYLKRSPEPARRVLRTEFRVAARGELLRDT
jgi:hypothetical protein